MEIVAMTALFVAALLAGAYLGKIGER